MGVQRYTIVERQIVEHVGLAIRRERTKRRWTQAKLGDKCGEKHQVVQKWECGDTAVSVPQLCAVAQAFGISPATLLPTEFVP